MGGGLGRFQMAVGVCGHLEIQGKIKEGLNQAHWQIFFFYKRPDNILGFVGCSVATT